MVQLRNRILIELENNTWEQVDKVVDANTTEQALEQLEKFRFNNSLLVMGDYELKTERFTHAYTKDTYTFDLLMFYKNTLGHDAIKQDVYNLKQLVTGNSFGLSSVGDSFVDDSTTFKKYNDKIYYTTITLTVWGYEAISGVDSDNFTLQPFYFANNSEGYLTIVEF